jgi:hypothetical protein
MDAAIVKFVPEVELRNCFGLFLTSWGAFFSVGTLGFSSDAAQTVVIT